MVEEKKEIEAKVDKMVEDTVEAEEKSKEDQEAQDLVDELKVKRDTLQNHENRILGTDKIMSCDKELSRVERILRMKEIEIANDAPVVQNANFAFELVQEWRDLKKTFSEEELEKVKFALEAIKGQKENIMAEIPHLHKKINELEGKLNLELTKYEEVKEEEKKE